jgi:hypothetical protein
MEIQRSAQSIAQPATSLSSEEQDARRLEVGGAHSSEELW